MTVLEDIHAHLATAHLSIATDSWSVLSSQPPSLQTFARYGQRFGAIEPHFKDYKSAAFGVVESGLRNATALTCLFMLLDCAYLIAIILGMMLVHRGERARLDWHGERGLSFLQLGLRELTRLWCEHVPIPRLLPLVSNSPPAACASRRKREALDCRIQFSKVLVVSS